MYVNIYIYLYMYVCTHMSICIYVYICTCVCKYTFIHTHIWFIQNIWLNKEDMILKDSKGQHIYEGLEKERGMKTQCHYNIKNNRKKQNMSIGAIEIGMIWEEPN